MCADDVENYLQDCLEGKFGRTIVRKNGSEQQTLRNPNTVRQLQTRIRAYCTWAEKSSALDYRDIRDIRKLPYPEDSSAQHDPKPYRKGADARSSSRSAAKATTPTPPSPPSCNHWW